jgi:hypothetical protein
MLAGRDPIFGVSAETAREAMKVYGAVIVSFLGGIRWGLGMHRDNSGQAAGLFASAVIMPILAWLAVFMPRPWDLVVLAGAFLIVWTADLALSRAGGAPPWFAKLRSMLTGAVLVCLIAAFALWPFLTP